MDQVDASEMLNFYINDLILKPERSWKLSHAERRQECFELTFGAHPLQNSALSKDEGPQGRTDYQSDRVHCEGRPRGAHESRKEWPEDGDHRVQGAEGWLGI